MRRKNSGLSLVIGVMLILILFFSLAASQLLSLENYASSARSALAIEEEKLQERTYITSLTKDAQNNIAQITVKNTGSIAVLLRSLYADHRYLFDPSETAINPNGGSINPNSTLTISFEGLQTPEPYNEKSVLTIATQRGSLSMAAERSLANPDPLIINIEANFGPLKLIFDSFYYASYDTKTGAISSWKPGWSLDTTLENEVVWNITVKNVYSQAVQLTKTSCFVLMSIDGSNNVVSWYMNSTSSVLLNPQDTKQIVFQWNNPDRRGLNDVNSIFSDPCRSKIFMAFFGNYQPSGLSYAQTIPFESVEIFKS